ncbi:hypothetical protein PMAYCL1PPCAC_09983, partial [Pristionchus mayeri]
VQLSDSDHGAVVVDLVRLLEGTTDPAQIGTFRELAERLIAMLEEMIASREHHRAGPVQGRRSSRCGYERCDRCKSTKCCSETSCDSCSSRSKRRL